MSFSGGNGITLMSKITLTWINHLLHGRKLLYIIVTNMRSSVIFFVLYLVLDRLTPLISVEPRRLQDLMSGLRRRLLAHSSFVPKDKMQDLLRD